MKNILDSKVTGSMFVGSTWREFAERIPDYFLGYCAQPIVFIPSTVLEMKKGKTVSLYDGLQELRFGRGDTYWKYPNNLNELKANYPNMDGVFYIQTKERSRTYRTKLPKEVMDIFIAQL